MSTAHDETLTKILKTYQDEGIGAEWKFVDAFFGFLQRKTNLLNSNDAVKRTQGNAKFADASYLHDISPTHLLHTLHCMTRYRV